MGAPYRINVQGTDISFECGEGDSVLHAMIQGGKGPFRYGCCGGGCGVCKAKIVSGNYFAFKPMSAAHVTEEEKKQGFALLCCVEPRGDLTITAV